MGSILQPNISGRIKLSHGEAYLPHDKGNDDAINRLASKRSSFANVGFSKSTNPTHLSRLFGSDSSSSSGRLHQHSGIHRYVCQVKSSVCFGKLVWTLNLSENRTKF